MEAIELCTGWRRGRVSCYATIISHLCLSVRLLTHIQQHQQPDGLRGRFTMAMLEKLIPDSGGENMSQGDREGYPPLPIYASFSFFFFDACRFGYVTVWLMMLPVGTQASHARSIRLSRPLSLARPLPHSLSPLRLDSAILHRGKKKKY